MQGGYPNEDNQQSQSNQNNNRSSGGLIPITARILNTATITQEEGIEYEGIVLSDICIVGYIKEYKEYEARVNIQIWDQTGTVSLVFYNKNESESNAGLFNFHYDGQRRPVKVYGTTRVYKREKNVQGAKIVNVNDNDLFYHYLEVMNDWIFLTGKLNNLKKSNMDEANENARSIAREGMQGGHYGTNMKNNNNNKPNQNQMLNPYDIAQNVIDEYSRRNGKMIQRNELHNLLQKKIRNDEINNAIKFLLDQGFIAEEDDNHYLIN